MPPAPPVISTLAPREHSCKPPRLNRHLRSRPAVQPAEHLRIEPEHAARAVDDRLAVRSSVEPVEDRREVADVFLVELAMAAQVGERSLGRPQRC